MKGKAGYRETTLAVSLYTLSPFFLIMASFICENTGAAAWINYIINSVVAFFMVYLSKSYFRNYSTDIITVAGESVAKWAGVITGIIYLVLNCGYTCMSMNLYSEAVSRLSPDAYDYGYILLIPVVSAVICAYFGTEANTRTLYVIFFIVISVMAAAVWATVKSWDAENFFPVLGNDAHITFSDFRVLGSFAGLTSVFVAGNAISRKTKTFSVILKSFFIVFAVSLFLIVIYTVAVPDSLNTMYDYSFEGLFSSTLSGGFFHRFELFMLSLMILADICAVSFGILLCARIVCTVVPGADYRPFVLIFGLIVYLYSRENVSHSAYISFCMFMTFAGFFIPLIFVLKNKFKKFIRREG